MSADAVAAPTPGSATRQQGPGALTALTRHASLNAMAALLDYAGKVGVQLVVTPILVSGLGRALFGAWEILTRLVGYVSATDGRPTEVVRLVVAQHQGSTDDAARQRVVGAALVVWALVVPLMLVGGAVLVVLAPILTNVPAEQWTDVRLCTALLVATSMATTLVSIPEAVLRGSNLGYKRMGLQALVNVAGGGLAAAAVMTGLGLPGVGGAQLIRAGAMGVLFWLLVRVHVSWFRVAKPALREVASLFRLGAWLTGGDLIAKAVLASDVVILGAVLAPEAATTYVLTGYAGRLAVGIHMFTAGAAIPGVGGMLGAGQLARAGRSRQELLVLTWLFVTAAGTGILLWNRSFLSLWVGPENYAGGLINLLVVLITAQTAFIRVDAYLLDAALRPRQRVLVGAGAAAVTIGLGIMLTRQFGVPGMCLGLLAGRAVQSLAYPVLVRRGLSVGGNPGVGLPDTARLAACTAVAFGTATVLGNQLVVPTWSGWLAGVALTLPVTAAAALRLGPSAPTRAILLRRCRTALSAFRGA
ncbi:MAG TPA: hypothetical protein VD793_09100 [Gemmatimonadales bacterium]|nr:hypothetical protein [Gemmatimonadales bacterium]